MKAIHRTLTGDVADIYIRHVPAFKGLDRERIYEMVMSSPALAAECYTLFQKRPDLFSHLLVDRNGQPIEDPEKRLRCGRSIDAVMAVVVRAVAKRYFLSRFGVKPAPPPAEPVKREKRLPKFIRFRRPKEAEKAVPKVLRKATRGDSLYRAMRHHLVHPWQLKLIPHYTPLPVSTVRELGAKILDYKSVHELKTLLKDGVPVEGAAVEEVAPAPPPPPAMIRVKMPESKRANTVAQAKAEAMWTVAEGLHLTEIFSVNESEMRRIINSAAVASGSVITTLTASGLSVRALVVLLCAFERQLGQNRLLSLFGQQAPKEFIERLAAQIVSSGFKGVEDPQDIRNRADLMIRRLQRDQLLPA